MDVNGQAALTLFKEVLEVLTEGENFNGQASNRVRSYFMSLSITCPPVKEQEKVKLLEVLCAIAANILGIYNIRTTLRFDIRNINRIMFKLIEMYPLDPSIIIDSRISEQIGFTFGARLDFGAPLGTPGIVRAMDAGFQKLTDYEYQYTGAGDIHELLMPENLIVAEFGWVQPDNFFVLNGGVEHRANLAPRVTVVGENVRSGSLRLVYPGQIVQIAPNNGGSHLRITFRNVIVKDTNNQNNSNFADLDARILSKICLLDAHRGNLNTVFDRLLANIRECNRDVESFMSLYQVSDNRTRYMSLNILTCLCLIADMLA